MKKYDLLYLDPPWTYRDKNPQGGCEKHYATLTTPELCDLPIQRISAVNSLCYLWATYPLLPDALKVLESYGFAYKTVAFVWVKLNKDGKTPFFGVGHYTASNSEIVLVGKKGKGLPRINKNVSQIITAPRTKHSEKPLQVIQNLDHIYGNDINKIEIFARSQQPGWDAVGLDLNGVDIRDYLNGGKNGNK